VLGDGDRLIVALDALLENAVAHTEPGDRIEVSVRLDDDHVVIAVTDSGCGIPPADLERIFGRGIPEVARVDLDGLDEVGHTMGHLFRPGALSA